MSKFKKYIIIIVVLIIAILLGGIYYYKNYMYSLEKVSTMLNSAEILNKDNIYIQRKTYSGDLDECTSCYDYYKKDNMSYIIQENNINKYETFFDGETSKEISVSHNENKIFSFNIENNDDIDLAFKETFFILVEQHGLYEHRGNYKFHGKETINGKKCIKVSLTDNYENEIDVNYFYIDLETNFIVKYESYSGKNKKELQRNHAETVEYNFNTVTDDQVLKFDINNYPDYEYIEF